MAHKAQVYSFEEIQKIHPKLLFWLHREFANFEEKTLKATVYLCAEKSCPIEETILEWGNSSHKMALRLPKELSKISQLDFLLSLQKQKGHLLDIQK